MTKLKSHKIRGYRVYFKMASFILLVFVTCFPIYYITFTLQPNYRNIQMSNFTVRQFQVIWKRNVSKIQLNEKEIQMTQPEGANYTRILRNDTVTTKMEAIRKWIVKTHQANETLKHKQTIEKLKRAHSTLCQLWPNKLVGRLPVSEDMWSIKIPPENLKLISTGGLFRPKNCTPREKVAVIIPYRDRETQLQITVAHLHTILQRQELQYGIYVVEMALPTQFNRGLLANVGFLTASSITDYTCYVIHDVGLLMVDDRNLYRCGRVTRHLVAYSSKYDDNIPYLSYFGGVSAFSTDQYWSVNGFSNLYFGAGGEDDDMVSRIFSTNSHFSRPKKNIGGYVALNHEERESTPVNPHKLALLYSSSERRKVDGVRSIKYSRLALEFKPLYTWVLISVKEANIMQKYQEYLQIPDSPKNQTKITRMS